MRAHFLQHVSFEGLGAINSWLERVGAIVTCTKFFEAMSLPDPRAIDLLVVVGGPMSVNDETMYPWLVDEKAYLRKVIERGTPVLGVCLGAQLIANAMGARVYPNGEKEIGWFPIHSLPAISQASFRFPRTHMVFHWHGQTFDLPAGAVLLARSAACEHQAFQLGERTIGIQFHLETTSESVRELVAHCPEDLTPARYVQSQEEILGAKKHVVDSVHALLGEVLDYLVRDARAPQTTQ